MRSPGEPPQGELRGRLRDFGFGGAQGGRDGGHDGLAGVVAGRLRALRALLRPDGMAQRGHLPRVRRPRGGRQRKPALRPAQQLARQRQPRQGPPPPLAHQAKVRPQGFVGRSDAFHGQLCDREHGTRAFRVRVRAGGRVGARGGRVLGPGKELARSGARGTRGQAREAPRRRSNGTHLRESRGSRRQPGPASSGPGHTGDVCAHGDERRGDGGPDRGRSHLRQGPRRRPAQRACGPRARGRTRRRAGVRVEVELRLGQGQGRHHERSRRRMDRHPDQMGQRIL
mmetsp:Transcript_13016/g.30724  ORF Transcript_13016/g.30724 Transcript_13016/m.30724 type:complete len:284 (-) Transcript_13016:1598-2449(-)